MASRSILIPVVKVHRIRDQVNPQAEIPIGAQRLPCLELLGRAVGGLEGGRYSKRIQSFADLRVPLDAFVGVHVWQQLVDELTGIVPQDAGWVAMLIAVNAATRRVRGIRADTHEPQRVTVECPGHARRVREADGMLASRQVQIMPRGMPLFRELVLLITAAKNPLAVWQPSGSRPHRLDDLGDGAVGARPAIEPIELPGNVVEVDVIVDKTRNQGAATQVYHSRLPSDTLFHGRDWTDGDNQIAGYRERFDRLVLRVDCVYSPVQKSHISD